MSATFDSIAGTATLIMAISARATLLPAVAVGIPGVGCAHEEERRAGRMGSAGGRPLTAVREGLAAAARDGPLDVGGIRRRPRRLGHAQARADPAAERRHQPFLLLRF